MKLNFSPLTVAMLALGATVSFATPDHAGGQNDGLSAPAIAQADAGTFPDVGLLSVSPSATTRDVARSLDATRCALNSWAAGGAADCDLKELIADCLECAAEIIGGGDDIIGECLDCLVEIAKCVIE